MSVRCTVAAAKTRASVLCAPVSEDYLRALRARHPGFREALMADAKITSAYRGERHEFRSRRDAAAQLLRLALVSDAFLAQALYRAKAALQARGVPLLPRIAHRLAMALAQVSIGDPVVVQPGIYILHGQVVIDGTVEIGTGVTIAPFVTIGLRAGDYQGATIERNVSIGTGAKIIGAVRIGEGATIGANAVVVDDVPAGRDRRRCARSGTVSADVAIQAQGRRRHRDGRAAARGGDRLGRHDRRARGTRSTGSRRPTARSATRETERRLLRLRHLAGLRALDEAGAGADFAAPDAAALPAGEGAA